MDPNETSAKKTKSKGRKKTAPDPEPPNENVSEEHPSSSNHSGRFQDQLQDFREKWRKELQLSVSGDNDELEKTITFSTRVQDDKNISDYEKMARSLFLRGVDMEEKGKLYEAIQFYRRAIQMVPDIEFKLRDSWKVTNDNHSSNDIEENYGTNRIKGALEFYGNRFKESNLLPKIKKKMNKVSSICVAKSHQETTHISVLPVEIILYILRWLVSSDLDLRSLEMFSQVCRGFYICARDSEIWRLTCLKVWGVHCGKSPGNYGSWRQMFIDRSRLLFNGCYISKTTYIRHGENNFQDQSYRPWHLIAYFRYLRFFPEGLVLMLTSSEEPSQCISQLRYRNTRAPVLSGYYWFRDDKVTLIVHRQDDPMIQNFKRNKNREINYNPKQSFHVELQILNHRNKKHIQLKWTHYSIRTITRTGDENVCVFDLTNNTFPPFWFSRVKSYTIESENPLN